MGFRLNCDSKDGKHSYCGGGLYGYIADYGDAEKLPSGLYLLSIGKDIPYHLYHSLDHQELTAKQFRRFIKLYRADKKAQFGEDKPKYKSEKLNLKELRAIIRSRQPVIIYWGG